MYKRQVPGTLVRQASTNIFVIIGRPANTEFAPDGVVVDLRMYGCWNGGAV